MKIVIIRKPIKSYLDLFVNTSLNHLSIKSCLVSQPNNKLKLNNKELLNATDLLPITFIIIFDPKIHGKKLSKFLIKFRNLNKISKVG